MTPPGVRGEFVSKFRSHGSGHVPDPEFARALQEGSRRDRRAGHKDQQLCRQVQRALSLALEGELADLSIQAVFPLAGSARLLVQVMIPDRGRTLEMLEQLRVCTGALRARVAQSISRKRVPELTFVPVFQDPEDFQEVDHEFE